MFRDVFERVCVVSLARRPERWESFRRRLPSDWPFRHPQRVAAVDGRLAPAPSWWRGGPGAWGCYRSHLRILEECLNTGVNSVLLLEDDAAFTDDFAAKVERFFRHLPDDWGFIYLGGQHLQQETRLPRKINEWVYVPFNVNRTHCFGLRGRPMIELVYRHLNGTASWQAAHHIDHHLGELHKQMLSGLYAPREWLVTQAAGQSDVNGEPSAQAEFRGADELARATVDLQMVAVVGPFRAGTSCVAGVLHALGIDLGERYPAPTAANPKGFFEAEGLARICRLAYEEPWLTEAMSAEDRVNLLRRWAGDRCTSLRGRAALAGGKHPTLCLMGADLLDAWNEPLFVIVDRPLEESVQSLLRTGWNWPEAAVRHALPLMVDAREAFLQEHQPRHLRVPFHRLLERPDRIVDELCDFLSHHPTESAYRAAVEFVGFGEKR